MNHKISTYILIGILILLISGVVIAATNEEKILKEIIKKNENVINVDGSDYVKQENRITKLQERITELEDELQHYQEPTDDECRQVCMQNHPFYLVTNELTERQHQLDSELNTK